MITVLKRGDYRLIETRAQVMILYLDQQAYAWIEATGIGEILVSSHTPHHADHVLAVGRYWLYDVSDEPRFIDNQHLELLIGDDAWQGYILPTGLPSDLKTRSRIVPTKEVISRARR